MRCDAMRTPGPARCRKHQWYLPYLHTLCIMYSMYLYTEAHTARHLSPPGAVGICAHPHPHPIHAAPDSRTTRMSDRYTSYAEPVAPIAPCCGTTAIRRYICSHAQGGGRGWASHPDPWRVSFARLLIRLALRDTDRDRYVAPPSPVHGHACMCGGLLEAYVCASGKHIVLYCVIQRPTVTTVEGLRLLHPRMTMNSGLNLLPRSKAGGCHSWRRGRLPRPIRSVGWAGAWVAVLVCLSGTSNHTLHFNTLRGFFLSFPFPPVSLCVEGTCAAKLLGPNYGIYGLMARGR